MGDYSEASEVVEPGPERIAPYDAPGTGDATRRLQRVGQFIDATRHHEIVGVVYGPRSWAGLAADLRSVSAEVERLRDGAPEFRCPSCGAVTRARLADSDGQWEYEVESGVDDPATVAYTGRRRWVGGWQPIPD